MELRSAIYLREELIGRPQDQSNWANESRFQERWLSACSSERTERWRTWQDLLSRRKRLIAQYAIRPLIGNFNFEAIRAWLERIGHIDPIRRLPQNSAVFSVQGD